MADNLTPKFISEIAPPAGRAQAIFYDAALPGFGLRITKSGARSLILNFRVKGVERRITLASVRDDASKEEIRRILDEARKKADGIKARAKYDGVDPMAKRHADRAAATVAGLTERYVEEHLPKKRPSTQTENLAIINSLILPALRNKRVAEVSHSDVDALHRKITNAGAPYRANRTVSLLSKLFNLAISWGWRPDNPAKGIERNPENPRHRYLTPDELRRLSAVLAARKQPSADAIRMLLLTGARRGEVLSARWDQFDLAEGIWTKPSAHTKQKKEHRVPISAPARQLIAAMRAAAEKRAKENEEEISPYLFPGRGTKGERPQTALKRYWEACRKDAKLSGVRPNDLRHTYASVLASAGQSLPIIGALLGHTNPNTTARYAHLFDNPLRAATERAATTLASMAGTKRPAKVTTLRPRG